MDNGHGQSDSKEKIVTIYSDFMMRIAKFDELVSPGNQLLVIFQQALGFLQRDPIDKTSKLVERIIKANESRRVLSYFEAGCANSHESVQNWLRFRGTYLVLRNVLMYKTNVLRKEWVLQMVAEFQLYVYEVHTCHLGLQDYMNKAKIIVDELESLLGNAASAVQTAKAKDENVSRNLDSCIASSVQTAEENNEDLTCNPEISTDQERPDVADYGSMMAIVYSMVKQDYTMQVQIVSSLNHKSSQGELETYCQMWNLRPYVDDELLRKAWNLVPGR